MTKIEVYTMNNCGYCEAAKSLLANRDLDYQEINITDDDGARKALMERTAHRTLPQIFINDQFIGGYQELKKYFQESHSR